MNIKAKALALFDATQNFVGLQGRYDAHYAIEAALREAREDGIQMGKRARHGMIAKDCACRFDETGDEIISRCALHQDDRDEAHRAGMEEAAGIVDLHARDKAGYLSPAGDFYVRAIRAEMEKR